MGRSLVARDFNPGQEARTTAAQGETVRYMLLIYGDEDCYRESSQLAHQLHAAGQFLATAPLFPTSIATSVQLRGGKRLITDGPFAETREQLGGFFMIEAGDLDEAIDVASRIPMASRGTVEIRPVIDIPGLPVK
jgi:hypothetical protein